MSVGDLKTDYTNNFCCYLIAHNKQAALVFGSWVSRYTAATVHDIVQMPQHNYYY